MAHDKERIVVTEIPYGVNKAKLVERFAELAREKLKRDFHHVADESWS